MKKSLSFIIALALCFDIFADNNENENIGKAVKHGKNNASAIAWSIAGISLLITIGIVTAIVIQNEK
jgi:hypothetical protein